MQNALNVFVLAIALAAPVTAVAQDQDTMEMAGLEAYAQLADKDQRRLDFYAEKIVLEIQEAVLATQAQDVDGFNKHGQALRSTAERFLTASQKLGLSEVEADLILHRKLIADYVGPLPPFMVTNTGPAGVTDLVALVIDEPADQGGDYVDSIRSAGGDLLNN